MLKNEQFYEDLQDLLELAHKKDVLFIIGKWNTKIGSQEIPGVSGRFGLGLQNEAGQRLIEFCQENALGIANTVFQQHKRMLYIWTSPDGQHQNKADYIQSVFIPIPKKAIPKNAQTTAQLHSSHTLVK